MNAQQMLIQYAETKNDGTMSNEAWLGKAIQGGIVFNRTPMSKTYCNIRREGKTIIVTETTEEEKTNVVDGKVNFETTKTTTEILRVEI